MEKKIITETEFKKLDPREQWDYLLTIKEMGYMFLDNDSTSFTFDDEKIEIMYYLDDWCSNAPGIGHMLDIMGFKWQNA